MKSQVLLLVSFVLAGCDYYDDRLQVKNMTQSDIAIETYLDTIPDFPSVAKMEYYLSDRIESQETKRVIKMGSVNGWPFFISNSKNNKLNLVVFRIDSIKKYPSIDTLIKNKIYTQYTFTQKELEDSDWTVEIKE